MRNRLFLAGLAIVLAALLVVVPAAQPVEAQGNMIVCDSTLVTLLYVAEHDYGFKSMMDLSTLEKGQLKGAFEAMMAMMMEATPEATMEATPEAMMEATADASMMTLAPGNVQGENEFCTKLRAEIEAYLVAEIMHGMMK